MKPSPYWDGFYFSINDAGKISRKEKKGQRRKVTSFAARRKN